jgi:cell division protein YceG involved in septum cleavage
LKTHDNLPALQEGTYIVSGAYRPPTFLDHLAKGPEKKFISYTVLEGWSMYDIDDDLAKKGYIQP